MAEAENTTSTEEKKEQKFEDIFPTCKDIQPGPKYRTRTANFGVVVCSSSKSEVDPPPHEYLAVDEKKNRGWWLPAGFVDPGESIADGAKRECVEEAGINPELTGVLRIEYGNGRCRYVYSALPADATQEPKSIPDQESNGADWFTVQKMKDMSNSEVKFRGFELFEFGHWLDTGYVHPGMDFLISTYEDSNPTWTRYQNVCPTDTHMKTIVLYNGEIYLQDGKSLPCYVIRDNVKNRQIRNWCKNALPFKIRETLLRVVRVYHAMRADGASMGFVFAVQAEAKPGDGFVAVSLDNLADVSAADREILEYANDGAKCWNMCLLDSETMEVQNPGAPDELLGNWEKLS